MKRFFIIYVAAIVSLSAAVGAAEAGARTYVVKHGDTLEGIARAELGDAARWREIQRANGVRDVRRLAAGDVLTLPDGDASTASPGRAQEPIATDRGTRRSYHPGHALAPAQPVEVLEAPTASPMETQDPVATASETRRPYRDGDEIAPAEGEGAASGCPVAGRSDAEGSCVPAGSGSSGRCPVGRSSDYGGSGSAGHGMAASTAYHRDQGAPIARPSRTVVGTRPTHYTATCYPVRTREWARTRGAIGGRFRGEQRGNRL